MSSIRSLATITVLAIAGIFLYLKINEVEPILPPEVEGFQLSDLPFGEQPNAPDAAPEFGAAPTFNPNPAPASPSQQPPAWNDSQTSTTLATPPMTQQADASPSADGSSAPDLPPLPALPPPTLQTADSATTPGAVPSDAGPPAFHEHAMQSPPEFSPSSETLQTQPTTPQAEAAAQAQSSLFSATRLAVEAALDRGELSQALLLLSDWYDDPSLPASESQEVNDLLRQLAGTVIYSTEHRLEPPYMVQAGERLEDIAQKYTIPWQLLAKINGITPADQLRPGQHLKVLRGPFSALIDLGKRKMTLMLDRRYAGQFSIEFDSSITVEEGHWAVNQKLLTPGNVGLVGSSSGTATEERSLMLSSPSGSTNQLAILRGSNATAPSEPAGRVIHLHSSEVEDIYDILSLGSRVIIRR